MVREISTGIVIEATAERVWDVLVDFAAYPQWNPFLLNVRGAAEEGRRIRFWFELPRGFQSARLCNDPRGPSRTRAALGRRRARLLAGRTLFRARTLRHGGR